MRRTFPQAFGTGNHLVDSFHVLFPRRKSTKICNNAENVATLCAVRFCLRSSMDRMTDSGSVDMGSIPVGGTNYSFKRLTYNKLSVCFFNRYNIGKTWHFVSIQFYYIVYQSDLR